MSASDQPATTHEVSSREIFSTFFRIGLFTLGGGLAMTTVVRHELVLKHQWVKDEDFLNEMSTATLVPGAIAVNLAYLQGRRLRGPVGSFLAVAGTVLPSFIIILMIAMFAMPYFSYPKVEAFLRGCAVAVAGQIAFSGLIFARRNLRNLASGLLCLFGIFLVGIIHLHPVWTVISSGFLGYFIFSARDMKTSNQKEPAE
ncbi:MAG: chromate transporter [Candidatus Rifleibacteriota bacterium]